MTTNSNGEQASKPEQTVPLCVPEIRGNEWRYMKECLDTNWVSSVGSYVDRFEQAVAARVGAKCGVATVNGTSALHMALVVAGVEPGDEVLVSALTFIAPANAVRYAGAWPLFIDAEPRHYQMDVRQVKSFLEDECAWNGSVLRNRQTGRRVKALLPVHILGHPVDMDPLLDLARKYGLAVIEDATEGLGAQYRGQSLGALGDVSCFSFNGNKIITTGGGGMLVTNNPEWAARAKYLTTQAKDDPVEYVHNTIGYNYRLTNLQAAMGCAQMESLDLFIQAKRRIASRYQDALIHLRGVHLPQESERAFSTFWLYTIRIDEAVAQMGSREVLKHLSNQGIQTRPLWQPLHRSPAHDHGGNSRLGCENADLLYRQALSLPCSAGLSESAQNYVIDTLVACLEERALQARR